MPASTQENNVSISPKTLWLVILSALVVAFISYPFYQKNVDRQTHKEAVKALNKAASLQAQYFKEHGNYTDQVTDLGLPASGGASSFMSNNWQYRIKLSTSDMNNQQSYQLITLPYADKVKANYSLDSDGRKTHSLNGEDWLPGWPD